MKNQESWISDIIPGIMQGFEPCRECGKAGAVRNTSLPGQKSIHELLDDIVSVLFPGCHGRSPASSDGEPTEIQDKLSSIAITMSDMSEKAISFDCKSNNCEDCTGCKDAAREATSEFLKSIPLIRILLHSDIEAAYEGDPAAKSKMEVAMSYPGLYAVTVHRIAHRLHELKIPLIPRVMSERAHSLTGIDIHPGASIGPGFFIDHGTGVVIGETCIIGKHVKLYQGVTLGALSFDKDENGNLIKGVKRHPDVEDNVIIYAGATILGGDTRIGHDSVIGGNVWLINSVPPNSKVYNQQPQPLIRQSTHTSKPGKN